MTDKIEIFTDGSCLGNPGPGGVGVLLRYKGHEKTISKGFVRTTNNRMELLAVIVALESLKRECNVSLYSDSQYMKNGINQWIHNWKRNNWRTAAKQPVKNKDLWQQLDGVIARHHIEWHWVKGHAGHIENERVDVLARQGATNPTLIDEGYCED